MQPIPEHHETLLPPLIARAVPPDGVDALAEQWMAFLNTVPVMTHTACVGALHPGGVVSLTLPELKPWHLGGFSGTRPVANGAATTGLMDGAFGAAANLHAVSEANPMGGAATVDLSVQLMRPTLGPTASIYAAATQVGRQLVFVEAVLIDGENTVTGRGTATCMKPQS